MAIKHRTYFQKSSVTKCFLLWHNVIFDEISTQKGNACTVEQQSKKEEQNCKIIM